MHSATDFSITTGCFRKTAIFHWPIAATNTYKSNKNVICFKREIPDKLQNVCLISPTALCHASTRLQNLCNKNRVFTQAHFFVVIEQQLFMGSESVTISQHVIRPRVTHRKIKMLKTTRALIETNTQRFFMKRPTHRTRPRAPILG